MKRFILVILVAMLLSTNVAFAVTASITADVLNLRDSPKGEIIGSARYGSEVEVLEGPDRNGYYKISYKGAEYYAYGSYLQFAEDLPELPQVGEASTQKPEQRPDVTAIHVVTPTMYLLKENGYYPILFVQAKKEISIRKYAEPEALRLGWVQRGEPVIILDTRITRGFIKVQNLEGTVEGYTFVKYLSLEPIEGIDYSAFEECEILDADLSGICWTYAIEEEEIE